MTSENYSISNGSCRAIKVTSFSTPTNDDYSDYLGYYYEILGSEYNEYVTIALTGDTVELPKYVKYSNSEFDVSKQFKYQVVYNINNEPENIYLTINEEIIFPLSYLVWFDDATSFGPFTNTPQVWTDVDSGSIEFSLTMTIDTCLIGSDSDSNSNLVLLNNDDIEITSEILSDEINAFGLKLTFSEEFVVFDNFTNDTYNILSNFVSSSENEDINNVKSLLSTESKRIFISIFKQVSNIFDINVNDSDSSMSQVSIDISLNRDIDEINGEFGYYIELCFEFYLYSTPLFGDYQDTLSNYSNILFDKMNENDNLYSNYLYIDIFLANFNDILSSFGSDISTRRRLLDDAPTNYKLLSGDYSVKKGTVSDSTSGCIAWECNYSDSKCEERVSASYSSANDVQTKCVLSNVDCSDYLDDDCDCSASDYSDASWCRIATIAYSHEWINNDDTNYECYCVMQVASSHKLCSESGCDSTSTCFSNNSIVYRSKSGGINSIKNNNNNVNVNYEMIYMEDVQVGDYVMTSLEGAFSKVIYIAHKTKYDNSNKQGYMRRIYCDEYNITMSYNHLVYVNGRLVDNLIPAIDVNIGDILYFYNYAAFDTCLVKNITENVIEYYKQIVTENGDIIVNNILASNFIGKNKWDHIISLKCSLFCYNLFGNVDFIWNNVYITLAARNFVTIIRDSFLTDLLTYFESMFGV